MKSVIVTHQIIRHINLLSDLPDTLVDILVHSSSVRNIKRGGSLFSQGDTAKTVYAVISGQCRLLQHTLDGQDVTMSIFTTGDLIGVVAVIGDEEYPGTCQTVDDAVILAIPATSIQDLMQSHAAFGVKMVHLLVQRIHDAHDHIRELTSERVERRLARTILRLTKKIGVKSESGIRLNMPLSRQDLAEMCGTTLYTVSRILSEWQRDGLVEIGRESVSIQKPHNLVLIAEDLNGVDLGPPSESSESPT